MINQNSHLAMPKYSAQRKRQKTKIHAFQKKTLDNASDMLGKGGRFKIFYWPISAFMTAWAIQVAKNWERSSKEVEGTHGEAQYIRQHVQTHGLDYGYPEPFRCYIIDSSNYLLIRKQSKWCPLVICLGAWVNLIWKWNKTTEMLELFQPGKIEQKKKF